MLRERDGRAPRGVPPGAIDLPTLREFGVKDAVQLHLPLAELTGHLSLVGPAGCGKTTAVKRILLQLWQDYQVPFLVAGPLLGEYDELESVAIIRHLAPGASQAFLFFDQPPDVFELVDDDELPLYAPVILDVGALGEQEAGAYLHALVHALCTHLDETASAHDFDRPPRHVLVLEQARLASCLIPTDLDTLAHYGHGVILIDQTPGALHDAACTNVNRQFMPLSAIVDTL